MSDDARVYWLTGLSGAGKSSAAEGAATNLKKLGFNVKIVDGDEVRRAYPVPMGYSKKEIIQNNRNTIALCQSFQSEYDILIVAMISPYESSRREAREAFRSKYSLIYCDADIDKVISRDVKGLYKKAREGALSGVIGFDAESPYEIPEQPDCVLQTNSESLEQSIASLTNFIIQTMGLK